MASVSETEVRSLVKRGLFTSWASKVLKSIQDHVRGSYLEETSHDVDALKLTLPSPARRVSKEMVMGDRDCSGIGPGRRGRGERRVA